MSTIKEHMPIDFAKKFGNTRVILNATEQPIKKPSHIDAVKIWSSYKHKNTLKTMIDITPNGAVSFVSSAYAGSAYDRQIIERSTLLDADNFFSGEHVIIVLKRHYLKTLKYELPISKVLLASRIVFICFALSNLRNFIVDKSA
jgi:hypothetical protein